MSKSFCRLASLLAGVALVCLVVLDSAASGAENAAAAESRLRETASYLASDSLEGRGVGTAGLNQAADYLAEQFSKLGLRTDLFHGTPFQEFEVPLAAEMGPAEHNRLTFVGPKTVAGAPRQIALKLGETFNPLAAGGTGSIDAPLVFAGYGITAKNLKQGDESFVYDDYAGIDAKGKVAIILRKEPQQKDKNSPFNGTQTTQHAYFTRKLDNAVEHGAVAVIFVNDQQEAAQEQSKDKGELLPFSGAGDSAAHRKLPVLFATRAAIDELLQAAGINDLAALEQKIDKDLAPRSSELNGWRAVGETQVIEKSTKVKNVVAVLEGEGPLADETIVIGAHYDHLGLGGAGSLAPWTTDIHNGADDNASGTATLIEVAERLTTMGHKPRHRIVFIAFTGEERGLLGSAHYTREPRFPLEKTIAMFNLDMVGRLTDDKLAVYGTGTAQEFDPLVERLCKEQGFQLTKHAGGFGPSDHSSFYAKKIPVLHLFTGTHSDYHRPSDDTEKLNIAGMRRVANLLFDIVQATDSRDTRPAYIEIRRVETMAGPADGDRPSFGSMPAYPNPVKDGVLLEAVLEGTPADKAGIKGGDVLTKFGDNKITILEDFEAALRQYKPGDKVKVTIRRGQESIEAEVTLARRRGMP